MKEKEARQVINDYVKDLIEVCPHCDARAHIEALWNEAHTFRNGDVEFYVVFRCKPCKKLMLKTFRFEQNRYSNEQNLSVAGWKEMYPSVLDAQLGPEEKQFIPKDILDDYEEALKCQSIKANRAACAMFRRALQSALIQLGADSKLELIKQIESLSALPSDVKDWAHQIRIFGNWGAHPDKDNLKDVDESDATETHDFMSKFLLYVFIMPEKVKLSRQKREKKATQGDSKGGAS